VTALKDHLADMLQNSEPFESYPLNQDNPERGPARFGSRTPICGQIGSTGQVLHFGQGPVHMCLPKGITRRFHLSLGIFCSKIFSVFSGVALATLGLAPEDVQPQVW
jgi:hypothetical protein